MKHIMWEVGGLLAPQPRRLEEARRRARALADRLRGERYGDFNVRDVMEYGSVFRGAAISSFADIDLLVIIDPECPAAEGPEGRPSAVDAIRNLADFVEARKHSLADADRLNIVSARLHSVGVEFPDYRIRVDLVPALLTDVEGRVLVPRKDSSSWIPACPDEVAGALEGLFETQPRARGAIRLLKGWRRAAGLKRLPGYAVEVLVLELVRPDEEPLSSVKILRRVWDELGRHDPRRRMRLLGAKGHEKVVLRDPWTGANVLDRLNGEDRGAIVAAAREASETLRRILHGAYNDDRDWAREQALRLFVGRPWEQKARAAMPKGRKQRRIRS